MAVAVVAVAVMAVVVAMAAVAVAAAVHGNGLVWLSGLDFIAFIWFVCMCVLFLCLGKLFLFLVFVVGFC